VLGSKSGTEEYEKTGAAGEKKRAMAQITFLVLFNMIQAATVTPYTRLVVQCMVHNCKDSHTSSILFCQSTERNCDEPT
jgi:hypothetical protein